jgi:protein involved in polysaccharide export with SLBB domain
LHVFVIGAVTTPGPQFADEARWASVALGMAGGPLDAADLLGAYVLRGGERTPLRLKALVDGDKTADLALRAGDALVVPRLQSYHIVGQIIRPGVYTLDQAKTLLDAWALIGGPLEDANLDHCILLRDGEQPKTVDMIALVNRGDTSVNLELKPGDTFVVPKTLDLVYVLGQVSRPGPMPLKTGDTLADVIGRAGGPTALADAKKILVLRKEDILAAARRQAEAGSGAGGTAAKPAAGAKGPRAPSPAAPAQPMVLDISKIGAGELAYQVRPGDLVYVPATREVQSSQTRQMLISTLTAMAVGLVVRR